MRRRRLRAPVDGFLSLAQEVPPPPPPPAKWRAETGARNLPRKGRNTENYRPETGARQPNPRKCRGFSDGLIGTSMLEEVPPRNPILRGEHRGLRTHDRGKVAHYGRDLVRIHAEDDIDIITKI